MCIRDSIKDELAALIDDDASCLIAVGVMLHQVKTVTPDFVLVNGVPRPDAVSYTHLDVYKRQSYPSQSLPHIHTMNTP